MTETFDDDTIDNSFIVMDDDELPDDYQYGKYPRRHYD